MGTVLPNVVAALKTIADAALSVNVLDGYGNTDDPGDYLMIGVDDPNNLESARGGHAESDWIHVGHTTRKETGYVTCAALSWNGDLDLAAARTAAYATVQALEDACKTDPTLGGVVMFTAFGDNDYIPNVSDTGAEVIVVFSIHYQAYI